MSDARVKKTVLAALRCDPDTARLALLPPVHSKAGGALLRWLDQSGLSLLLLKQLELYSPATRVSEWTAELAPRLKRNTARLADMLAEFQRLVAAFEHHGVRAAALKGFTLVPDFCPDASRRHQADFDFLVTPESVDSAAEALKSCGYTSNQLSHAGETCFTTPLRHIPTADDDLYALQRHRQVDLHVSIWEECSSFPLEFPTDCLNHAQPATYLGVSHFALSLEDKFLVQVYHAFRHAFRSWVRLSWIREISHCLEIHARNDALWDRVVARAGDSSSAKLVFGFVLGLANRLFGSPIPPGIQAWTARAQDEAPRASRLAGLEQNAGALPPSLPTWLDHFALEWAIADWPGSLANLFLAASFIPTRSRRVEYIQGRLLPKNSSTSIGQVAVSSGGMFIKLQASRLRYVTHRAAVHLRDIFRLPLQQFRWKRALQASRRNILGHTY